WLLPEMSAHPLVNHGQECGHDPVVQTVPLQQDLYPDAHGEQAPEMQCGSAPLVHAFPHLPQLLMFVNRSTHIREPPVPGHMSLDAPVQAMQVANCSRALSRLLAKSVGVGDELG